MNGDWQVNETVAAPILDARAQQEPASSPAKETWASLLLFIVVLSVVGVTVLLSDRFLLSSTERGPGAIEDFLTVYLASLVMAGLAICLFLSAGVSCIKGRVGLLVLLTRYGCLLLAVRYGYGDPAYALRGKWQQAPEAPAEYSPERQTQWQTSYRSSGPQYACEFYRDTLTIHEQGQATSLKFAVDKPAGAPENRATAGKLVLRGESELYASFELRQDRLLLLIERPQTRKVLQPVRMAANGELLPSQERLTLRPLWLVRSDP